MKIGYFASGCDDILKIFHEYSDPLDKVFTAYNLGVIFWATIGNGENARKFFKLSVENAEEFGVNKVQKVLPSMVANACENLMHLSLTYDEHFEWVEKLRKLDSTDDVLRGLVPKIQEMQQRGIPWSHVLELLANNVYNREDPKLDRGEYARAVSTYHLILLNRKSMRLPREDWSRIIYEYGTLALRVSSDMANLLQHSRQPKIIAEFLFVVQDAKPFVDEFLAANPSDKNAQFLLEHMEGFISACK